MKKLLAIFCFIPTVAWGQTATISWPPTMALRSGSFGIPVHITCTDTVGTVQFAFEYNSNVVDLQTVTIGDDFAGSGYNLTWAENTVVPVTDPYANKVSTVTLFDFLTPTVSSGHLVTLWFTYLPRSCVGSVLSKNQFCAWTQVVTGTESTQLCVDVALTVRDGDIQAPCWPRRCSPKKGECDVITSGGQTP